VKIAIYAVLRPEGLNTGELVRRFGYENVEELVGRLREMARDGLLICDGSSYRLMPSRVLTSNPIFAGVLGS